MNEQEYLESLGYTVYRVHAKEQVVKLLGREVTPPVAILVDREVKDESQTNE